MPDMRPHKYTEEDVRAVEFQNRGATIQQALATLEHPEVPDQQALYAELFHMGMQLAPSITLHESNWYSTEDEAFRDRVIQSLSTMVESPLVQITARAADGTVGYRMYGLSSASS